MPIARRDGQAHGHGLAAQREDREVFAPERHVVFQLLEGQARAAAPEEIGHLHLPRRPDALHVADVAIVQAAGDAGFGVVLDARPGIGVLADPDGRTAPPLVPGERLRGHAGRDRPARHPGGRGQPGPGGLDPRRRAPLLAGRWRCRVGAGHERGPTRPQPLHPPDRAGGPAGRGRRSWPSPTARWRRQSRRTTNAPAARASLLHELLFNTAARRGERIALLRGDQTFRFDDLAQAVEQTAGSTIDSI